MFLQDSIFIQSISPLEEIIDWQYPKYDQLSLTPGKERQRYPIVKDDKAMMRNQGTIIYDINSMNFQIYLATYCGTRLIHVRHTGILRFLFLNFCVYQCVNGGGVRVSDFFKGLNHFLHSLLLCQLTGWHAPVLNWIFSSGEVNTPVPLV